MRLYLSSYHLGFRTDALRRPSETGRAGVILNALDVKGSSRDGNLGHEVAGLEALGYRCEELDLRDYFEVPASLSARLRGLDMVWVVGGNSFVLARAMGLARFSQALPTGAARDFTYAGYSAGACVAGPDLTGIDLMDDPDAVPHGYPTDAPPNCLNLVPFRIVPHWDSHHPETAGASRAIARLDEAGMEYRRLRDGEVILVDDSGVTLS